ncbi:EAL domain-containing protein [Photobacterium kishitanii]|nr:EAL domain-containing protein [Photobacterium kishitanii]
MYIDKELLLSAITGGKIKPYLQPIVNHDIEIKGFEVLSRWERHNSIILPYDFICLLKENNALLERWTLSIIEQLIMFFISNGKCNIDLHINIYSKSFSENIIERILFLNEYVNVVVEILEDDFIEDEEDFKYKLMNMRSYGIQFAIDDFGCGFNNTDRLSKYKFDILKIDRKFILSIENNLFKYNLIKNIISLSDDVDLKIIAEGVESVEQFKILNILGVKCFQGFLFYKAMPLNETKELIW